MLAERLIVVDTFDMAEDADSLVSTVAALEPILMDSLRRITREQLAAGLRYAVSPVFAAIIGAPS